MSGVIYKIVNLVTSSFYVGSSNRASTRFVTHRNRLKRNKHHCAHLQAAWNKYGASAFAFVVVKELETDEALFVEEQKWLDEHVGKEYCYNHSKHADTPFRGLSKEEHPRFNKPKDDAERLAISSTLKAFYAESPENHPRYGKTHTDETRAKISENRKGKMAGADHYRFGKQLSTEVKAKISAAQLGRPKAPRMRTEEGKQKIREAAAAGNYSNWTGKKHSEESRAKMSKRVVAVDPFGQEVEYASITKLREEMSITAPTITRALQSGKALSKGARRGWSFRYI
jgi:group I intron endonuclease